MPVIKLSKRIRFTSIANTLLNDEKLSLRAKGLLCYLLSKPEDWVVNVNHLVTTCKEGRDAIYSVIDELLLAGYMTREQSKENGRFMGYDYTVYELPFTGFPLPENPDTEIPTILKTDISKDGKSKGDKSPAPPIDTEKELREKTIAFMNLVIDWGIANPDKYPKLMFKAFVIYWTEKAIGKKKIKLRYEDQKFFDVGRRLATWFSKSQDVELQKMWEEEKKLPSVNEIFKQILGINGKQ